MFYCPNTVNNRENISLILRWYNMFPYTDAQMLVRAQIPVAGLVTVSSLFKIERVARLGLIVDTNNYELPDPMVNPTC